MFVLFCLFSDGPCGDFVVDQGSFRRPHCVWHPLSLQSVEFQIVANVVCSLRPSTGFSGCLVTVGSSAGSCRLEVFMVRRVHTVCDTFLTDPDVYFGLE